MKLSVLNPMNSLQNVHHQRSHTLAVEYATDNHAVLVKCKITSEWAILTLVSKHYLKLQFFEYHFIIANISMMVRRIILTVRPFIEIRCLFMPLNDN